MARTEPFQAHAQIVEVHVVLVCVLGDRLRRYQERRRVHTYMARVSAIPTKQGTGGGRHFECVGGVEEEGAP